MKASVVLITSGCLCLAACGSTKEPVTLASLKNQQYVLASEGKLPEITREEVRQKYRDFINYASGEPMYGNAMARLADIELELAEKDALSNDPERIAVGKRKMQAAARMYQAYLETYPGRKDTDLILYQLAKAYDLGGEPENTIITLQRLVKAYPYSRFADESQFRIGETMFVLRRYAEAEQAYQAIVQNTPNSHFFEQALYKYGWSQFKQSKYPDALQHFIELVDRKYQQGMVDQYDIATKINRSAKELLDDTLRVTSLTISYQHGATTIKDFFKQVGGRPYEPLIYHKLGDLYVEKDLIKDAADTYLAYVSEHPESEYAPRFHQQAITAYKTGRLYGPLLATKQSFTKQYAVNGGYWNRHSQAVRDEITPLLKTHLTDLATYFHAEARKTKRPADFNVAAGWYEEYIRSFPKAADTANMNFLLAESLFDAQNYPRAVTEYEKTAYQYPPHPKDAEAAYAALLAYNKIKETAKGDVLQQTQRQSIESALRYCKAFPQHKFVPMVLADTAERLYAQKDYLRALSTSQTLLAIPDLKDNALLRTAWTVNGHSQFELGAFAQAELAYRTLLPLYTPKDKPYRDIGERLAASIYKQGEQQRAINPTLAANTFLRVGQAVPWSSYRATAEYDAATIFIQANDYQQAGKVLENFRRAFPNHPSLNDGVSEKLALIYSKTGQEIKAAGEMERLARGKKDSNYQRQMLWQAAALYREHKHETDAIRIYHEYVKRFPHPLTESVEARNYLAEFYRKTNKPREWGIWLNEIVKADRQGGKQRTDRTRYLAANATLLLAIPYYTQYKQATLGTPLKKTLARKKALMETTLKAYQRALEYRVAEVTTASTYHIADVYSNFASSLMSSKRPANLKPDEQEQYNLLLEEQAYPFEEKAISIHTSNVQNTRRGIYDEWVEKSLTALRKLFPIRYAKTEKAEGFTDALY